MEKTERGRIQGLPKFMWCPQLSQECLKLWASNLARTFAGLIRAKAHAYKMIFAVLDRQLIQL